MPAPAPDAYAADSGARPSGPTAERNTVLFTGHTHVRMARPSRDRVASPNPYWNEWGVTVEDPDGYRLVLCRRGWSNS